MKWRQRAVRKSRYLVVMKRNEPTDFEKHMEPVTGRISTTNIQVNGVQALSAAGVSLALILVVAQIGLKTTALTISMWCATIALPLWICMWQVSETYQLWGSSGEDHFKRVNWLIGFTVLYVASALLSFASVSAMIWHLSAAAALIFICVCLLVVTFVGWHVHRVKNWILNPTE